MSLWSQSQRIITVLATPTARHTTVLLFASALKQNEALEKAFSQFYDPLSGNPPFHDYLFDFVPSPRQLFPRFYAFKQSTFMYPPIVLLRPHSLTTCVCVPANIVKAGPFTMECVWCRVKNLKEDFVGREEFSRYTVSHFLGS